MNDVIIGAVYRHYKQLRYRVLNVALLESSHQELVVYECLYDGGPTRVWARPKTEFLGAVQTPEYTGPRFVREAAT